MAPPSLPTVDIFADGLETSLDQHPNALDLHQQVSDLGQRFAGGGSVDVIRARPAHERASMGVSTILMETWNLEASASKGSASGSTALRSTRKSCEILW